MNRPPDRPNWELLVDVGNSSVKVGRFNGCEEAPAHDAQIQLVRQLPVQDLERAGSELLTLPEAAARWTVASVSRPVTAQLARWVAQHRPADEFRQFRHADFPIELRVEFPQRVGLDRVAAAVAANALRPPDHAAIIIDAGTAITIDAVNSAGQFLGGLILPGPQLAARSLATQTDQLPQVEFRPQQTPNWIGKNTTEAIHAGIYWSTLAALQGIVTMYLEHLESPVELFLTGGAIVGWSQSLPIPGRFVPDLVLRGIACACCARRTPHASS